jgi:tetratricopeptide (TPR) repeat protein
MLRRLLMCGLAVLLMVASVLFLLLTAEQGSVLAASQVVGATPPPDATAVLNAANNALSQAQDILNIVGVFTAVLGVVLALLSIGAAALAFLGVRSYREVRDSMKEVRESMAKMRVEANKTREALVYIGLADRLFNERNVAEALTMYKKAGSLLPKDAQVQYVLGRIYSGVGDYDAAISALSASHSQDTIEQARTLKELGLAYRRRWGMTRNEADFQQAIEHLQKSNSLNPNDSDTLAIMGGAYRRKKQYQESYKYYQRAWQANPGSSYALSNLASLAWRIGKQHEAQMYFGYTKTAAENRLKQGQSENFWDYYDLALAQLALGNLAQSRQSYQRAIQETRHVTTFDGVLDNLYMLQQAPQAMPGLNEIICLVEEARGKL